MFNDPIQDPAVLGYGTRTSRLGADGRITIICYICEKPICRETYRGFSTAICAVCAGEIERGKRPEDIIAATVESEKKLRNQVLEDLGPGRFKVFGIGKRIKEVIETVKKAAQTRRRKPLFEGKDQK